MSRAAALLAFAALAGCAQPSDPRLDAAVRVTPDGVRVYPSAGVRLGNVGVTVSP